MEVYELFHPELIQLDFNASNKADALHQLAELLKKSGRLSNVEDFEKALQKREDQSTTGVGDEIAIPHAQDKSVTEPVIVFARQNNGVEWESFDGQPAKLIFMIAAPTGAGDAHLKALAHLSGILMKPEAKKALLEAQTPTDVIAILKQYSQKADETEKAEDKVEAAVEADLTAKEASKDETPYILAVTACPTGIAHTFMAAEKLKSAAEAKGYHVKVETNGQAGVEHKLTKKDIDAADGIIVAADKNVPMARFDGHRVVITKVADGINIPDQLIKRALKGEAPIYHAEGSSEESDDESGEGESIGRKIYKHLMNGVSHMLPFVVAGGLLIALSFFWGINSANPDSDSYNQIAAMLNTVGGFSFSMMLPVLAGFIGQSMADRPGLVVGFIGGLLANPTVLSGQGILADSQPSGFLGALVAGFLSGGIIYALRLAFKWLPKSLEGLKPILLYPVFGVLLMGILMIYIVNAPMAAIMTGLTDFLTNMNEGSKILVGIFAGGMMAIDMGGPFNKAAYVTGTGLLATAMQTPGSHGSDIMAAVMIGGMVPPVAIALSATIDRNLWPKAQADSALVNYVMGAAFITEGAIPFAASNPLKVIPSMVVGSALAGAISMGLGVYSAAPHGGIFALLFGGITNPLGFLIAWAAGSIVGALLLIILLRNGKTKEEK